MATALRGLYVPSLGVVLALVLGAATPVRADGDGPTTKEKPAPAAPKPDHTADDARNPPANFGGLVEVATDTYAWIGAGGTANAGAIVTREGVVLVDALASKKAFAKFVSAITKKTKAPIRYVVLTHWHLDHTAGLAGLGKDVKIVAHPKAAERLWKTGQRSKHMAGGAIPGHKTLKLREIRPTDMLVKTQKNLELGGRKIVVARVGAGHTAGDLVVWLPTERILFSGDLVTNKVFTIMTDAYSFSWIAALSRIQSLEPARIVPGHGAVCGLEAAREVKAYLFDLRRTIKHLLKRKVLPKQIADQLPVSEVAKDWQVRPLFRGNVRHVLQEIQSGR